MKSILLYSAAMLWLLSCQKAADAVSKKNELVVNNKGSFIQYTIKKGAHATEQNAFTLLDTEALKFVVRFDSSAVYQTTTAENQHDINKLYGFADNNSHHHQFSARFGWRWSEGALRLFAYNYNNGIVDKKELGIINIDTEVVCSITVTATEYIFTLNDHIATMPRLSTTPKAKGYLLYPYFGGDETAPHDVNIWIKNN